MAVALDASEADGVQERLRSSTVTGGGFSHRGGLSRPAVNWVGRAGRKWSTAALTVVIVMWSVGCAQATSQRPPPGGISRADAIAIGIKTDQVFSSTPLKLVSVAAVELHHAPAYGPSSRWVWTLVIAGTFPSLLCGPAPPPGQAPDCSPQHRSVPIVIDYFTGQVVSRGAVGAPT